MPVGNQPIINKQSTNQTKRTHLGFLKIWFMLENTSQKRCFLMSSKEYFQTIKMSLFSILFWLNLIKNINFIPFLHRLCYNKRRIGG